METVDQFEGHLKMETTYQTLHEEYAKLSRLRYQTQRKLYLMLKII